MRIWVDMDNAPHVLVLRPLVEELKKRGHEVFITSRRHGQTVPLLDFFGLEYKSIGKHGGKNKLKKIISILIRSVALYFFAINKKFDIAFCHGSRSLFFTSKIIGIPFVLIQDYEHGYFPPFVVNWVERIIMPEVVPAEVLSQKGVDVSKFVQFPGLKEEFYIYNFKPDPKVLDEIGVDRNKVIIVLRPPATMAHYHTIEGENLFWSAMHFLAKKQHIHIILLPRTSKQLEEFKPILERLNINHNIFIPQKVIYGPNLIWNSDLVISGGGTMNREAACLGVPVYSLFRGPSGAVDRYLSRNGKLILLKNSNDLEKIRLVKRNKQKLKKDEKRAQFLREFVVDKILEIVE